MTVESKLDEVVSVRAPDRLDPITTEIPGDFSSAAFFLVAGLLASSKGLLIRNVGVNPTRGGLLGIVEAMGGRVATRSLRVLGGEPVADILVSKSELRGIQIPPEWVPLAIDEFPVLFIAAAMARGYDRDTRGRGIAPQGKRPHRRHGRRTSASGASTWSKTRTGWSSTAAICAEAGWTRGATTVSRWPSAVAGTVAREPIEILGVDQVSTSFPDFERIAAGCGFGIETTTVGGSA